ncbi:hypothetical protein Gpo141_00006289 [Globisporangium polare]
MGVRPQSPVQTLQQVRPESAANSSSSNSATSKLATKAPKRLSGLHRHHHSRSCGDLTATPLPADVQQLKEKILESHPEKLTRFSLSHMKRIAIPPVEIPKKLKSRSAISTVVSGKNVPFTKNMWENRKKKTQHLDMIDEYVLYR